MALYLYFDRSNIRTHAYTCIHIYIYTHTRVHMYTVRRGIKRGGGGQRRERCLVASRIHWRRYRRKFKEDLSTTVAKSPFCLDSFRLSKDNYVFDFLFSGISSLFRESNVIQRRGYEDVSFLSFFLFFPFFSFFFVIYTYY